MKLIREGISGRVEIDWMLKGLGVNVVMVIVSDIGIFFGIVIMEVGKWKY